MVELVLASAVMLILMTSSAGIMSLTERMAEESSRQAQAVSIAEEGIQAVISIGDRSWTDMAVGTHGLAIQSSPAMWVFQGVSDANGDFTRTVTVSQVDTDTRKITVTVTWHPQSTRTAAVSEQILLTDWAFI